MKPLDIRDVLPAQTADSLTPSSVAIWTTIYSYIRLCRYVGTVGKQFVSFLQYKHPKMSIATISRHLRRMADAKLIAPWMVNEGPPTRITRYKLFEKNPPNTLWENIIERKGGMPCAEENAHADIQRRGFRLARADADKVVRRERKT